MTTSIPHPAFGRNVRRGEVYLSNLEALGGRLWKNRPVVVVQNDRGNLFSPETIVAGIRSGDASRLLPICVKVPAGVAGLHRASVIDAGQLSTIGKMQLGAFIGRLPAEVMEALDRALRLSLAL